MDLSSIIPRSLTLSLVTLILTLHVGVISAASVSPSLDGTDVGVTQVTNLGATGTVENMDATGNTATDLTTGPTDVPTTAAMTTEGLTTTPKKMTTPGDLPGTTAVDATTTASPAKNIGFHWGTFFCIIILIACLIGIGFCGYQFYRKRQNDNYHTL
ncbi:uncharacterized protein [Apostichopus japonicus]|uniref:uncharacterized protein n=1 Tax=Stichopus japonicus TaxID=307972 RepID=UPI003AB7C72B